MQIFTRILLGILLSVSTFAYANEAKEAKDAKKETTIEFNTTAFLDKGMMPTLYTCDGKDISPQLDWKGLPTKTASLALVMKDPGAKESSKYHWIVYNMPKTVKGIPEGGAPKGITVSNSFKKAQYTGPCPPKGTSHTYIFTLYALDNKLSLAKGADSKAVMDAMKSHILSNKELSTVYSRWIQ